MRSFDIHSGFSHRTMLSKRRPLSADLITTWVGCPAFLMELVGEGKGDDVGTVCVADIVLKNNTGAPAILFAAASSKVHQIYFPNLRDSLLIMMKTQGTNSFNSIMLIVGV